MICKNCRTEFDTSTIQPGQNVRCPGCGKLYLRKAQPAYQEAQPFKKSAVKTPVNTVKRPKKRTFGGLLVLLIFFILLSLVGMAGIGLYRFAPETFHKVTFGRFAPEAKGKKGERYVMSSATDIGYDATGAQTNTLFRQYAYYNGIPAAFSYEFDANGYPMKLIVETDGEDKFEIDFHMEKEKGLLRVRLEGDRAKGLLNQIPYQAFSLYDTVELSDGETLLQIQDGKTVLIKQEDDSFSDTTETQLNPDGGKTVKTKHVYPDKTTVTVEEYDAKDRLLKITGQANGSKGALDIQYFREHKEDGTWTDHGLIIKTTGELYDKDILGTDVAVFNYDKKGILVSATQNDITGHPSRQLYYRDGELIQEVLSYYVDTVLSSRKVMDYLPLSEAQQIDINAKSAATAGSFAPKPVETARTEDSDDTTATSSNAAAASGDDADKPVDPTQPVDPAQEPAVPEAQNEVFQGGTNITPVPTVTSTPISTPTPTPTPTATPTPGPTTEPTQEPKKATILHCNNAANVRQEPNSGSKKLGSLSWGKTVKVLGQEGDWTMIEYKGGVAYVFSEYVAIHHTGTIVKVNNRVTVREAPDEDSERLGAINKGKTVEVIEIDGEWAMIVYKNGIAYIHSKFVELDD